MYQYYAHAQLNNKIMPDQLGKACFWVKKKSFLEKHASINVKAVFRKPWSNMKLIHSLTLLSYFTSFLFPNSHQ